MPSKAAVPRSSVQSGIHTQTGGLGDISPKKKKTMKEKTEIKKRDCRMQYKMFTIPSSGSSDQEEEMNRFLRSHRIVSVTKEFMESFWCFCVEYVQDGKPSPEIERSAGRIDYRDVLSEEDFTYYARIRDLRKALACQNGVPVYTVCTNEQMAQMVQNRCTTQSALQKIPGFGESKIKNYSESFLTLLQEMFHETDGQPS